MQSFGYFIALIITVIAELAVLYFIRKRGNRKNQLVRSFELTMICMMLWCIGLIVQILVINFISPYFALYADYFTYLPVVLTPVALFFISYIFLKKEIHFKKWFVLLFIIPIITMLVLWTNDLHHLFYKYYSVNTAETEFGPYFYVHSLYTYGLFIVDIIMLLRASAKQSSMLSKQSLLIIFGSLIPLCVNALGITIIDTNIYVTPISFIITILLFGVAILRYNFLSIAPIALKKVVDQMSDLYLVLNQDCVVSDCNKPFENIFKVSKNNLLGKDLFDLKITKNILAKKGSLRTCINNAQKNEKVFKLEVALKNSEKHYNVEISGIYDDGNCIGILILFKDITQHLIDMDNLEKNQNTLMERERLASLGQMIGGIAHNLKTPIMSIAGAADGLEDLITEYKQSIDDPEVTKEDHHAIANDMSSWISKIRTYDSYMSDVITAVKGQAVNMNDEKPILFTIKELFNRVNILMKHELKNALVTLNIDFKISENTEILGNINSLVQVLNNLISNAIQAYNGKPNQYIDLIFDTKDDKLLISVIDHGCGITKEVQDKLFSQMITTKGQKGTGLGLFMSYSTIKGHFKGDMNFESEVGKGTRFNILLPKNKI